VHATEAIAFTNAENIININIDNMTIALEAWMWQRSNANKPQYQGYRNTSL
jgi:phage replication-related protein YjqB (UPF0714/DUF867 family)